jgi:hypothetical protein
MKQKLSLLGWRLSLDGFTLSYTKNSIYYCASYDPCAFCNLLKEAGQIEEFAQDENGEPVVLFSAPEHPLGYTYAVWTEVAHYFPMCDKMAFGLLQFKIERENHQRFQATVNNLLSPLAA